MIQQWNEVCTIKVSEVKTPNVKDNSIINYLWDKIHSHMHMHAHSAAVCEDGLVDWTHVSGIHLTGKSDVYLNGAEIVSR